MSRIDDAWKRLTGAAAEPRVPSFLDRFSLERAPRVEERPRLEPGRKSLAAGPRPVEVRTQASTEQAFQEPPPPASSLPAPDQAEPGVESEKVVELRQIANYVGFLAGSIGRHKVLAAVTFSLALTMTAAAALLLPRTYHAGSKLLAQRNAVMAALSNPSRAVPWDADAPTRAAAETVLRRDNLMLLARQTNLLEEWDRTRVPILKVKDWLMAIVRGRRPTPDEKLDQLLGLLEARMVVVAGPVGDGTVSIDLDWPSADLAYRLVEGAQQTFVEVRQVAETAAISDAIAILERSAATLHTDIDRTLTELQRTQAQRRPSVATARAAAPRALEAPILPSITATLPPVPAAALGSTGLGADLDDPQIPRLKAAVTAKRQEITNLEDSRHRQLSELQGRLAQLTAVYTATHPSVVTVQQNIEAISRESPQVEALKAEASRLEAEYGQRVAAAEALLQEEQLKTDAVQQTAANAAPQRAAHPRPARTPLPEATDRPNATPGGETVDFASLRLRLELNQLQSLFERTDGARIELAVSQAAFKYRYTVIRPAQVPTVPIKPNLPMVLVAGLLGSLLLALAAVVGKDLLSNRILEPWQIERQLGLPVLGSLGSA